MKHILLFLFLLTTVFSLKTEKSNENLALYLMPESKVEINGHSNINNFTCNFDILKTEKPIFISFDKEDDKICFNSATLALNNAYFDCGGRAINNDFQKLLNSSEHPEIFLNLKEVQQNKGNIEAVVEMNIAGESKLYSLPVEFKEDKKINISGVLSINISDFHLKPPKKLFGIIVVSDIIEIDFHLVLKELDKID